MVALKTIVGSAFFCCLLSLVMFARYAAYINDDDGSTDGAGGPIHNRATTSVAPYDTKIQADYERDEENEHDGDDDVEPQQQPQQNDVGAAPPQQQVQHQQQKQSRPPLNTILNSTDPDHIIGDPGWLLDFGIVGYGKCGTSTMMYWLREHPEIQAFGQEMNEFMFRRPGRMIKKLYEDLGAGPSIGDGDYLRGYKSPQDITQDHIMGYYRQYWPQARLIIGIRHPVRWFESLYNFRVQNHPSSRSALPHPNRLIGACTRGKFHTCTQKGDFALGLMRLGKPNCPQPAPMTALEQQILGRYRRLRTNLTETPCMTNPVFLFDLEQLGDDNATRNEQLRLDVTAFMGLKTPLPALPHFIPGRKRSSAEQERRDAQKINICDPQYTPLRNDLMSYAQHTATWILDSFLPSPTVTVSSPDYFVKIMEDWMLDPCDRG
jgi:hypothetical protein